MPTEEESAPAGQGRERTEEELTASSVPHDPPPVPRSGLIWVVSPFGVFYLDIGHPALPFTRAVVADWRDLGEVWDGLTRAVQRALEADGIGRRYIEQPLVASYFAAALAAGGAS